MNSNDEPDDSRVCLSSAFDEAFRTWCKDLVDLTCEKAAKEFFPPCYCDGLEPRPHAGKDWPDDEIPLADVVANAFEAATGGFVQHPRELNFPGVKGPVVRSPGQPRKATPGRAGKYAAVVAAALSLTALIAGRDGRAGDWVREWQQWFTDSAYGRRLRRRASSCCEVVAVAVETFLWAGAVERERDRASLVGNDGVKRVSRNRKSRRN